MINNTFRYNYIQRYANVFRNYELEIQKVTIGPYRPEVYKYKT